MKNGKGFVCLLLIAIFGLSGIGCSHVQSAKEGKVTVTPLANNEFDIYSAGGLVSDRGKIIKKWEDAANETCKGKYTVTKEMTTGQSPAGTMTVEGRVRCK